MQSLVQTFVGKLVLCERYFSISIRISSVPFLFSCYNFSIQIIQIKDPNGSSFIDM